MSMMPRNRTFVRTLLALLLVGACFAAMVAPLLAPASAAAPQALPSASPGPLVISSFRFIGLGGEGDEYVELFNRDCTNPINLQNYTFESSDGAGGFSALSVTFGGSTSIQPGHYFLLAGPGYSGTSDATYTPGIPSGNAPVGDGGVAVLSGTAILDQVGFSSGGHYEGTPLDPLIGNVDQSYTRKTSAGMYVDSNDNFADFTLQNPSVPHLSTDTGTCGIPNPTTVTISGNVQAPGVTLSYTDGQIKSVQSGANGYYSLSVSYGWTGTVTPQKGGFTFSPSSKPYNTPVVSNITNENYAATLTSPTSMSVLINEVGWMGTWANATDQWLELYNPNSYAVDVTDLQLLGSGIGTGGVLNLSDAGLTSNLLPGHGFLLIEDRSAIFKNLPASTYQYGTITYSLTTKVLALSLSTYGTSLVLYDPTSFITIDSANYFYGHSAWPAGNDSSPSTRASMERHDSSPDSRYAWFTFAGTAHPKTVFDADNNPVKGSPGEPNWADTVTATPIPTSTAYHYKTPTPYPPTPYGHMVINEFLPRAGFDWNHDGTVDVFDEFVELKNLGPIAAQLSGWRIDVISPGGPSSYYLPSVTLQPNQRVVYYSSQSKLSLYDSGGTVRLINSHGVIVDARSYAAVASPDQSTCRIPDGYYWRFPCFPTPGLENSLTGTLPVPPPVIASQPPPCLLADTVPEPFKQAECNGFGSDVFNPNYWDSQSGFNDYPVPDVIDKNGSVVK